MSLDQRADTMEVKQRIEPNVAHELQIPEGYALDTLVFSDSGFKFSGQIVLPVSNETRLNELVRKDILRQLDTFLAYVDPNSVEGWGDNNFSVSMSSIAKSGNLISYCFMIDYYYSGSAHGMLQYYSYNYDVVKQKRIEFNEFFDVRSANDTSLMIREIKDHLTDTLVSFDKLYSLDFHLQRKRVVFDFDDYEIGCYAQGVMQSPIRRNSLTAIIRTEYR